SSPAVARRRQPNGGAYRPGRSASFRSKFWKQRSKPRESAYSRNSVRIGPISSAEVTTRMIGPAVIGGPLLGHVGRLVHPVPVGAEDLQEAAGVVQRREAIPLREAVSVSACRSGPCRRAFISASTRGTPVSKGGLSLSSKAAS